MSQFGPPNFEIRSANLIGFPFFSIYFYNPFLSPIIAITLLTCPLCNQIWIEKSREQKLDFDMNRFNATKAQSGENGVRK